MLGLQAAEQGCAIAWQVGAALQAGQEGGCVWMATGAAQPTQFLPLTACGINSLPSSTRRVHHVQGPADAAQAPGGALLGGQLLRGVTLPVVAYSMAGVAAFSAHKTRGCTSWQKTTQKGVKLAVLLCAMAVVPLLLPAVRFEHSALSAPDAVLLHPLLPPPVLQAVHRAAEERRLRDLMHAMPCPIPLCPLQFFKLYTELLKSDNYVTRRQSLKLLGELLLDRSNVKIMMQARAVGRLRAGRGSHAVVFVWPLAGRPALPACFAATGNQLSADRLILLPTALHWPTVLLNPHPLLRSTWLMWTTCA